MVLAFTLSMYRDIAGHEELTGKIIECGIRVHEIFGPGLLESVYRPCLTLELRDAGEAAVGAPTRAIWVPSPLLAFSCCI